MIRKYSRLVEKIFITRRDNFADACWCFAIKQFGSIWNGNWKNGSLRIIHAAMPEAMDTWLYGKRTVSICTKFVQHGWIFRNYSRKKTRLTLSKRRENETAHEILKSILYASPTRSSKAPGFKLRLPKIIRWIVRIFSIAPFALQNGSIYPFPFFPLLDLGLRGRSICLHAEGGGYSPEQKLGSNVGIALRLILIADQINRSWRVNPVELRSWSSMPRERLLSRL